MILLTLSNPLSGQEEMTQFLIPSLRMKGAEWIFFIILYPLCGFPRGTSGKEPTCQCRRHKRFRFNPWVGKIPRRRAWQPTLLFLLQNPKDRGALQAIVCGIVNSQILLKWLRTHMQPPCRMPGLLVSVLSDLEVRQQTVQIMADREGILVYEHGRETVNL